METRFDSVNVDHLQKHDIKRIKEEAEVLARSIDNFGMDARLKARAKSALEDVVLYAVKGVCHK